LLKRYVADTDLRSERPCAPQCKPDLGKRVAIVGAGPAGLAAAYYLRQEGVACTVFDDHDEPGGMLRYGVPADELERDVLDKEIALILKLGIEFRGGTRIGAALSMEDLRREFDAVFVATGQQKENDTESMGLDAGQKGITIDGGTYETNLSGVFAGGDAVRKRRLTVRAVADGKEAAVSIGQYLSNQPVSGPAKAFNTRIGKMKNGEIEGFLGNVSHDSRTTPESDGGGFSEQEARSEAARCLHCDCRKPQDCKLRRYAQQYDAKPTRFRGERRLFTQQAQHPDIMYEPGKCIDCGLCIQIAAQAGERLGLTFLGRGFDVRVAVPFDRSMAEGLRSAAKQCAQACPTGALAFKDEISELQSG
jgi:ferredoxin